MTFGEAQAELGIGEGATAEETRRAYLRLLKTRKPEADPDGFRRLRAAYELLRSRSPWTIGAVTIDVGAARDGARQAAPIDGETTGDAPADDVSREAKDVPRDGNTANGAPRDDKAANDGPRDGETALDGTDVTEALLGQAPREPDLRDIHEFRGLMDAGKIADAADRLAAIYDDAATRADLAVPAPSVAIDLVLQLHETNDVARARRLEAALGRWMAATGNEHRILGGAVPVWVAARSLGTLDGVTREVRAIAARVARTGDWKTAARQLGEIKASASDSAANDARRLSASGGAFGDRLAKLLRPPTGFLGVRVRSFRFAWLIAMAFMAIPRLMALLPSTPESTAVSRCYRDTPCTLAANTAHRLVLESKAANATSTAENAAAVERALETDECTEALARRRDLERSDAPPALRGRIAELGRALDLACGVPVSQESP